MVAYHTDHQAYLDRMRNTLPYIYLDGGLQSIQTTRLTSTGCGTLCHVSTWMVAYSPYRPPGLPRPDAEHFAMYLLGWWLTVHTDHQAYLDRMRNTLPCIYLDGGLQSIQTTRLTSTGCGTLCHVSTWMVAYSPYRPPGLPRPDVEHFAMYLLGWWLTVHTDHQAYLDRMRNTLPCIYLDGGLQSIQTTRLTSTGCRTLCHVSTWMVAYSPYRLPGLPRPDAEHFAMYLLGWWLTVHTDHQAYLDRMRNTLPCIYLDGGLQSIETTRLTSTGCGTLCHISTWMVAYSPYRPPGLPRPDAEHFAIYLLGWWLTVHTDH